MITELGAKRAMRVLKEAGFIVSEQRLPTMAQSWIDTLNEQGRANVSDEELVAGAQRYAAQDHPLHHWPSPGQLEACVVDIRNYRNGETYIEDYDDSRRAKPEDVRKAWEAAGIDLDELKRLHDARKARGNG